MWYIQCVGPYDGVFIGPFDSPQSASDYTYEKFTPHQRRDVFQITLMSEREMNESIAEFGELPLQSP